MALVRKPRGWEVRLRYGADQRARFIIAADTEAIAADRARRLQAMAARLAHAHKQNEARAFLTRAAGEKSDAVFAQLEQIALEVAPAAVVRERGGPRTFRDIAEFWCSGELHKRFPDDVPFKKPEGLRGSRAILATFYPLLGSRDVGDITTEDVDRAKQAVPRELEHATRRIYLRTLRRVFDLAVDPLRLRESSPVKGKFVPRAHKGRQFPFLYPSEDAQLSGYLEVEIEYRFLYAFLGRNGSRISETLRARWSQVDLERGVFRMENTKTGRSRYWKLDADVRRALTLRWHQMGCPAGDARIFVAPGGGKLTHQMVHGRFRKHLKDAGVNRVELHTNTPERRKLRVHDLRATFVTLALAAGKPERWVMDRTGHETSSMLARYSRQARHATELALGWFGSMDQVLGLAIGSVAQPIKPTPATAEFSGAGACPQQHGDPIELALADALRSALEAQQWDTVRRIAAELEERRRERAPAEAAE